MINDALSALFERIASMVMFLVSDIGAQYVYLALSLVHIWIACDRFYERGFWRKGILVEPPLRLLVAVNITYAAVFFLSVVSLGSNPLIARQIVIPYIRILWMWLSFQLVLVALVKTIRLILAWWKVWRSRNAHD